MTLYILNYNNYYNRITKREQSLSEYLQYAVTNALSAINFHSADNVEAKVTVNIDHTDVGDYLLAVDGNEIISRWFIIESQSTRRGQCILHLHRDLIADYFNNIVDIPAYIEKSSYIPTGDIAIYNKEDLTFNQIKKSETLLMDKTKCAWIVGYVSPTAPAEATSASWSNPDTAITPFETYESVDDFDDNFGFARYSNIEGTEHTATSNYKILNKSKLSANYTMTIPTMAYTRKLYRTSSSGGLAVGDRVNIGYNAPLIVSRIAGSSVDSFFNELAAAIDGTSSSWFDNLYNTTAKSLSNVYPEYSTDIRSYNNKIIKVGGKYYKCCLVFTGSESISRTTTNDGSLFNTTAISGIILGDHQLSGGTVKVQKAYDANFCTVTGDADSYYLELVESSTTYKIDLVKGDPATQNREHLKDAPYDMFCIPYPINKPIHQKFKYKSGSSIIDRTLTVNSDLAIDTASHIYTELTSAGCYDLQILPYCPLDESVYQITETSSYIQIDSDGYPMVVLSGGTPMLAVYWSTRSSGRININMNISIPDDPVEAKIMNETMKYRLSSPNYNGNFDFSPVMNNGVTGFIADFTYKPYSPYIHVAPIFSGLYGGDFNDARGLICKGDFSLATMSSAWENYEVQNKNYENIFNREISSLELKNSWALPNDIISAAAGTATAGVMGGLAGGLPGALGGAVLGAGAGIADIAQGAVLRNDALDYKRDMYNYNLGNIQALPNSLGKVSSLTQNNKYIPFLEIYECTDTERQALRDKIKYNGATIGRISTIGSFIGVDLGYIKGKIIRTDIDYIDYHQVNALANELDMGTFIKL